MLVYDHQDRQQDEYTAMMRPQHEENLENARTVETLLELPRMTPLVPSRRHLRGVVVLRHSKHLDGPRPLVSHGCLLLPVFFAAWWYYTKKYCRRISLVLRHKPESEVSIHADAQEFARLGSAYRQWEESNNGCELSSERLVKWINRKHVKRHCQYQNLHQVTQQSLYGGGSSGILSKETPAGLAKSLSFNDPKKEGLLEDSETPSEASNPHWECLQDSMGMDDLCHKKTVDPLQRTRPQQPAGEISSNNSDVSSVHMGDHVRLNEQNLLPQSWQPHQFPSKISTQATTSGSCQTPVTSPNSVTAPTYDIRNDNVILGEEGIMS